MRERMTNPPDTGLGSDQPDPGDGDTNTVQGENQHPVPRMPYERDESADSQARMEPSNRRVGEKAHADAQSERVDTSKAAEMDATYDRLRESTPDAEKKFRP